MTTPNSPAGKRITREQQSQLVQAVKQLLSQGKHPSDIKRAINREYELSPRSVERYITRARREMIDHLEAPTNQLRSESFVFYLTIINDSRSSQRERLRARERIDKLLGLDTPPHLRDETAYKGLTAEVIKNMTDEELEIAYKKTMK